MSFQLLSAIHQRFRLPLLIAIAGLLPACHAVGPGAQLPLILGEHVSYRVVNLDSTVPVLELPTLVDITTGERLYANLRAGTESPVQPSLLTRQWRAARHWSAVKSSATTLPTADPPALAPVSQQALFGAHLAQQDNASGRAASRLPAVLVGARYEARHFERDPGADKGLSLPSIAVGANAVAPRGHRVPRRIGLSWRRLPVPGQSVYGGQPAGPVVVDVRAAIPPAVLARVRDQWRYRLDIEVAVTASQPALRWRVLCFTDDAVHEIERGGHWT